ncbi:hypothetical protein GUITHDRAFT_118831 [Guillardia theta CCMP2712]|uniref:Uncharacterized protein n=1 Tax=Guillardia theta (strain CCMP2712) TaxID=905079 RepID=L1IFY3_GUITC|nr:hypothetical protein GUITHDRAFT_118831 [Guillardia theta CCMP2712]EKX34992.1 hypothetical protein GUITHDRAFT_118831 [Guillardia theta CCMP2712]|mmetsp:Transcript_40650/g.128174  ORF Transcript_40650/g.128174 Transcript_40650/m.128174 type:complete len:301 (-) Transcript_40650:96-998(-)|eukprot:XP_005821972.1 hypothetical protein GUITHDRAFT_118831 [Guillardia theta CCMP2712]
MTSTNSIQIFHDRVGCNEEVACCGFMVLESSRPHRIVEVDDNILSRFELQRNSCVGKTIDSITGEKTHSTWTFLHGIKLAMDQIGSAVSLTISCAKRKKVCKKLFVVVQQQSVGDNLSIAVVVPSPSFSHFLEPVVKSSRPSSPRDRSERSGSGKRKLEVSDMDRRFERTIVPSDLTFTHCAPMTKKVKTCFAEVAASSPRSAIEVTTSACYFDPELAVKRNNSFNNFESLLLPCASVPDAQYQPAIVAPSLVQNEQLDLCYETSEFDSISTDASSLDLYPSLCGYDFLAPTEMSCFVFQ